MYQFVYAMSPIDQLKQLPLMHEPGQKYRAGRGVWDVKYYSPISLWFVKMSLSFKHGNFETFSWLLPYVLQNYDRCSPVSRSEIKYFSVLLPPDDRGRMTFGGRTLQHGLLAQGHVRVLRQQPEVVPQVWNK